MEMKRTWTRPLTIIESFDANESVAANPNCTSGEVYKFTCDAPRGILYYYPNDPTVDKIPVGNAVRLGSYRPCNEKHNALTTSAFYDGFVDYNGNYMHDEGEYVIVWTGRWGYDGHATVQFNMGQWERAKS